MGALTEHATRLCLEIATMREARQALLAEMRRATQLRRVAVSEMLARFSKAQAETAGRIRTDLTSFLHGLRGGVDGLRKEVSADIVGIRQAWLGTTPAGPGGIRIQAPPVVITPAEEVEVMEGEPHGEPVAEPEREVLAGAPEAPEAIRIEEVLEAPEEIKLKKVPEAPEEIKLKKVPEAPEEIREVGIAAEEAGIAAKPQGRPRKKKRH